jgi:hypothetical protein
MGAVAIPAIPGLGFAGRQEFSPKKGRFQSALIKVSLYRGNPLLTATTPAFYISEA